MRAAAAAVLVALVGSAVALDDVVQFQSHLVSTIEAVNNGNATWKAGLNTRFVGATLADARRLLGTFTKGGPELPVVDTVALSLPTDFDARTKWSNCKTVHEIRDQADCGSCWAFGAAEAASDRVCIGTNGAKQPRLSSEDLLTCCGSCGMGCNGGYPSAAWSYFQETGISTGGAYDDFSWCRSYTLKPCDHHTSGKLGPCPSGIAPTPSCKQECDFLHVVHATEHAGVVAHEEVLLGTEAGGGSGRVGADLQQADDARARVLERVELDSHACPQRARA